MQFLRSQTVPQLYAASADGQPPAPGSVTLWFLLPPAGSAPAVLDLAASWTIAGTYLFLETPLPAGGEAAFSQAAWQFLDDPSFITPRIAWFPSGVPAAGGLSGYVLATSPADPSVSGRTLVVTYANYAVVAGAGTPLGLDLSVPAFTLSQTTAGTIAFTTDFGATTLSGAGSISIPLSGAAVGCLQFPLTLGRTDGISDLTHLDVGLRTYYPSPDEEGLVSSLRYPVFASDQAPVLQASLAPFSVAESRSRLTFASAAALRSCYTTVTGYHPHLAPVLDASGPSKTPAQLVLAVRPSSIPPSPDDLYTLVPKGDFNLSAAAGHDRADALVVAGTAPSLAPTQPNDRLMCGLSGVEYIGLENGAGTLSFFTNAPAYANGFTPKGDAPTQLTMVGTTAWVVPRLSSDAPPTYFAQPDQAVMYQPPSTASSTPSLQPLVYLEVAANSMASTVSAAAAVPLFPYGGVDPGDAAAPLPFATLERKVLSPWRRAIVRDTGGMPPAAQPHAAFAASAATGFAGVTPQGLLANFHDTTLDTIDELVLATMNDGSRLSLFDLANGTSLRNAIASNQLFLVVSNPDAVAPHLSSTPGNNLITIEGWQFDLDPAKWNGTGLAGVQGTTLIFKFTDGKLVDKVKNHHAWAKPSGSDAAVPFNADDDATSARIGKILTQAIDAYASGDADLASFVEAVTDPHWQGILILNAAAPLTRLPDQCKGLAAGIEPSLFFGHHVGINIAKIVLPSTAEGTPLSVQPSSMFALINYHAARIPVTPNGADYQFQVDVLKVLFENSIIASFSNTIELLVSRLFGDGVDLKPADRVLTLYGVLQRQTIGTRVYDTYLFQTAQNQPRLFPIAAGSVLSRVQVGSAQFITLPDQGDGLTHSYFALAGLLDFRALDGLDLFSFGSEASGGLGGLSYSKLLVRLVFNPQVQHSNVFAFDASGLTFDTSTSTARADSLYQHFPIALSAFVQAESGTSPTGLGYMGVQSPLPQTALSYPWYGLVFELNLGTLGALAAKAGFVAKLMAAWSPSSGQPKVFLGLQVPGSDGGKGAISIEGVLNLGFRTMVLGRNGPSTYYLLLNALALRFLGLSFPPGAQIDMALFGNPEDQHNSSLGWYVAYTKDQAQKQSGAKDRAAHAALRRTGQTALGLTKRRDA